MSDLINSRIGKKTSSIFSTIIPDALNPAVYGWDLKSITDGTRKLAIDTSHWIVDETKFDEEMFVNKAKELGLTGLIYKVSDANRSTGEMFTDSTADFWFNLVMKLRDEYKMPVWNGGYHWLQYSVDPTPAYAYYKAFTSDHPTTLPSICDFEEPSVTSASDFLWRLEKFLSLADADWMPHGDSSWIYTGLGFVGNLKSMVYPDHVAKMSWMSSHPLWLAYYSRYYPKSLWPWTEEDFQMWQYSPHADYPYYKDGDNVDGLAWGVQAHGIDMNWCKASYFDKYTADVQAYIDGENPPVEPPVVVDPPVVTTPEEVDLTGYMKTAEYVEYELEQAQKIVEALQELKNSLVGE